MIVEYDEIIKVQRPLFTTGEPHVLIYNEDHSIEVMFPWGNEWEDVFGVDVKIYCEAHLDKKGELHIGPRVFDRKW